eukprot:CAMPEP_0195506542 /NCGR_PEP_ID=MMETSP0794_2-20130614/95_1 /TAXON_ID=515487 /ORGANISM="Stephanopyxis turris, Strain CCMP 815" /LENGTH=781 /DNA_ID=CAMNT_0040632869 /DNA_START=81 /DNA_END=2426 /DNA_ORIENTATION=-
MTFLSNLAVLNALLCLISNACVDAQDKLQISLYNLPTFLTPKDQEKYGRNQNNGDNYVEVTQNGMGASMHGNMWRAFPFPSPISIFQDTVLDFDFHLGEMGEAHAICVEDDLINSSREKRCFTVAGTGSINGYNVPVKTFLNNPYRHYRIPIGHFYTGDMKYLCFILNEDKNPQNGSGTFSNIKIYENPALEVDIYGITRLLNSQIEYEEGQDTQWNFLDMSDDASEAHLVGNIWKALPFPKEGITITEKTVLAFEFEIHEDADFQTICLEDDNDLDTGRCFAVGGTQEDVKDMHLLEYTYESGQHYYLVRVGKFFTGHVNKLVLLQDNDFEKSKGASSFANIKIFEPESCLKNVPFELSFEECTFDNFIAGVEAKLDSITDCGNNVMEELMAFFDAAHDSDIVEKIGDICSSAYSATNLPFNQVTLGGYQFNQEYFDGGTAWNYEGDTEQPLAKAAARILITNRDVAAIQGISFPEEMHNFMNCNLRAVTCCWVADRQVDTNANLVDNSDVCYVDFTKSKRSSHVRDGYSIYNGQEGDLHCRGFAWGNDVGYSESALKGNNLFHVAMYDGLYNRGYVEEVPGSPLCGCVESMPVITRADCTELTVDQSVTVNYHADIKQFEANVMINSIGYTDCMAAGGDNDLSSYYERLVDEGKATADEMKMLDKLIVGDCSKAIGDFLEKKGFEIEGAPKDTTDLLTCGHSDVKQADYRGTKNETTSGVPCQRWDAQRPHRHSRTAQRYPKSGLTENYCRNPDNEEYAWCYTEDPKIRWQFCDVPHCD